MSEFVSQEMAVVATIDPQAVNDTNKTSDWVDMSKWDRVMFVLSLGNSDATSVTAIVQESADSTGGSPATITGKSITALDDDDDNKQCVIEVAGEEVTTGDRYVACKVTSAGGSTSLISVVGFGVRARYGPASDGDLASVAQIVTA